MQVLVIGSGGREHALCWKLAQSNKVKKIFCAPGNGGTALCAENIAIQVDDVAGLCSFAKAHAVDMVIVGPEAALVSGVVDAMEHAGIRAFGPSKELARLEGSKVFAKEMMSKFSIPTAAYAVFDDVEAARAHVRAHGAPVVVKADGLAAGKGVVVALSVSEALDAIDRMMLKKEFGSAGDSIIIEECLTGQEASLLALTDGSAIVMLASSQDHKRVFDGDQGPNTGGMGAYSPAPVATDALLREVMETVFKPLIHGMAREGQVYKGILYAGIMICDNKPYVLEFNCRFGDPETQAILPRLTSDFAQVADAVCAGTLSGLQLEWDRRCCLNVVLVAGGYPGAYEKGKIISGLDTVTPDTDAFVFHAGTRMERRHTGIGAEYGPVFITSGGRVLNVCALGTNIAEAQKKAYAVVEKINFEGMHYRTDIGNKAFRA